MKRVFAALCFTLLMSGAIRVAAQVNPYKDGTPGVTGYRSEVLAEVRSRKTNSPGLPGQSLPISSHGVPRRTCARLPRCSCT